VESEAFTGARRIVVVPSSAFMARLALHARASGSSVSQLVAEAVAGVVPREEPVKDRELRRVKK
jgi:hypothetical protein